MGRISRAMVLLVAAGSAAGAQTVDPNAKVSPALISQADALMVAQASLASCAKMGETAAVYVIDADNNLRVALSADNVNPVGLRSGRLKAAAVLEFKVSTRALEARLKTDPAFAAKYGKDERFFYHPGALPLFRDGKFVGVLALGGGHDKDEACALEALKLLPWAKTSA